MKKYKMKKSLPVLLAAMFLMLLSASSLSAQNYRFAAGWRFGGTSGVDVKIIPVEGFGIEGIVGLDQRGTSATLLLERHVPFFCIRAIQLYGGVGGHYRFSYGTGRFNGPFGAEPMPEDGSTYGYGVDVIAGVELKVPIIPAALSFDVKPNLEFSNTGTMMMSVDPAFGLKVAF